MCVPPQDWCILLQYKIEDALFRDLMNCWQKKKCFKSTTWECQHSREKESHPCLSLHRHKICQPTAQTCHSRICGWIPAIGFSKHLHQQRMNAKCLLNEKHLRCYQTSRRKVWRHVVFILWKESRFKNHIIFSFNAGFHSYSYFQCFRLYVYTRERQQHKQTRLIWCCYQQLREMSVAQPL